MVDPLPQNELPDKLYFRIGEVSSLAGVPTYVLRFWESEFTSINPKRTPAGQRLYRQQDVKAVLFIKHLLYDQKFTIKGARQYLKLHGKSASASTTEITFAEIYRELRQIRDMLK